MAVQTGQRIFTRDFILGWFAQFALSIVNYILIPTLPIYLSRLGSKEVEIGVLIGIYGVSSLVSRPFVGRALRKIPEKNFMMAGALLFAFTSTAYLWAPPFWPFLIVRVFQGIGLAFFNTAVFTLIANISPEVHRGQSFSYFWLAPNTALILAPVFGMFLINHFSFTLLFLVCLGVSLFSLLASNRLGQKRIAQLEDSSEGGFFFDLKALPPSIVIFFFYFICGALTTFFPLFAINNGVTNPGFFFTSMAIALILCRAFGGKILDLYSRENVIAYFLSICVISMIILAFSKTLPMFVLVGVIFGIGAAFFNPAVMAYTVDRAGSSRGSAMGTYTALSDLGVSLGPVIMGLIIPLTSYPMMFLCLALVGVISLIYFCSFVRKG